MVIIDFYTFQSNVHDIAKELDGRHSGMNGVNVVINAEIVKPLPDSTEWELFFGGSVSERFNQLEVGFRPDTIILSNLPSKWFQTDRPISELFSPFFSHYGDVAFNFSVLFSCREIVTLSKPDSLFLTIGVRFNTYDSFSFCMRDIRNRFLSRNDTYNLFFLVVDFDRNHILSEQAKKEKE